MTKARGWLVVQRYDVPARRPIPPFSGEIIQERYRGFDGIAWPEGAPAEPLRGGLLPLEHYDAAIQYRQRLTKPRNYDLVFIDPLYPSEGALQCASLRLLGYDYGNYVSENNCFSSILNEVLYGALDEMQRFGTVLNDALLFDAVEDAELLRATRARLSGMSGLETIEPGEEFELFGIFEKGL